MADIKNVSFTMGSGLTDSNPKKIPGQISLDTNSSALYIDIDNASRLQVKDPTKMDKFGKVTLGIPYEGASIDLVSLDESSAFALGIPDTDNLLNSNGYIIAQDRQVMNFNSNISGILTNDYILFKYNDSNLTIEHNHVGINADIFNYMSFGYIDSTWSLYVRVHEDAESDSTMRYTADGVLSGVSNPNNDNDAANKAYVDSTIHEAISWQDF